MNKDEKWQNQVELDSLTSGSIPGWRKPNPNPIHQLTYQIWSMKSQKLQIIRIYGGFL